MRRGATTGSKHQNLTGEVREMLQALSRWMVERGRIRWELRRSLENLLCEKGRSVRKSRTAWLLSWFLKKRQKRE